MRYAYNNGHLTAFVDMSDFSVTVFVLIGYFLSPHADRHAGDISFTVCVSVCLSLSRMFCKGYIWRGLMQGDEIW